MLSYIECISYISGMSAPRFPVRKILTFTEEQWEAVRRFRFQEHIDTEAEAVRRLIERALQAEEREPERKRA